MAKQKQAELEQLSAHRSKLLFEQADLIDKNGGRPDLVVDENETIVLSYGSKRVREDYREIAVKSLGDLKEVIGAPDSAFTNCFTGTRESETFDGVSTRQLQTRVAALPSDDLGLEESADEARLMRAAAHRFIFRDSRALAHWRPAVEAWILRKTPRLFVPFYRNITVNNGGTLSVAASTLAVYANKIRLFGTGQIVCQGPTTFDCTSFEGDL